MLWLSFLFTTRYFIHSDMNRARHGATLDGHKMERKSKADDHIRFFVVKFFVCVELAVGVFDATPY